MSVALVEKSLLSLIGEYKAGAHTRQYELEIRFKGINRDTFIALFAAARHIPTTAAISAAAATPHNTINVISNNIFESRRANEAQYIRQMSFDKTTHTGDTYIKKERIERSVAFAGYIPYSVGLARETPISKFQSSVDATLRFKSRMSIPITYGTSEPNWRLDMTCVKQGSIDMLKGNLAQIKQSMFGAAAWPDDIPIVSVDSYEVELEYIGDPAAVDVNSFDIVNAIFSLVNPTHSAEIAYQHAIREVARHIHPNPELFKQPAFRLKRLVNQVITLSKNTYYREVYPAADCLITVKADGQRALVYVDGDVCKIIKSDEMIELTATGDMPSKPAGVTIADIELLTINDIQTARVFDVCVIGGKNITSAGIEDRILAINVAVQAVSRFMPAIPAIYHDAAEDPEVAMRAAWETVYDYEKDGVIISRKGSSYAATQHYKWKPISHTTIDFLARKCPKQLLGISPYIARPGMDLYLLFVGIADAVRLKMGIGRITVYESLFGRDNRATYRPIQFSPSIDMLAYLYWHPARGDTADASIDNNIVELSRDVASDGTIQEWTFHRVRKDRALEHNYYGNDFRIAEQTYMNYVDVFAFEDLFCKSASYFTRDAGGMYAAGNKFRRYIISTSLKTHFSGAKWVVDEAAGRGADLHRYHEIGVENALFIDNDATAIAELINRKFTYFDRRQQRRGAADSSVTAVPYASLLAKESKALTVHTLVCDLTLPFADLLAHTYQYGITPGTINGMVCNFALHYMCDTLDNLRNLLTFNARMLCVGGLFMFTVMDGAAVFDLLRDTPTGQSYSMLENDAPKYEIRKLYTGAKITPAGQMISVRLPFSDVLYDEPLCNILTVIAEAKKLGLSVVQNEVMAANLPQFQRANRPIYDLLTADDKKYIQLFRCVVVRKDKEVRGGRK